MLPGNESEANERVLAKRVALNKDQAAFERLVQLHQGSVRAFLRRLAGGDQALADDLSQDTFIKAWLHISSFRGSGRFLGWLFKIAYQQFAQHHRSRKPAEPLPEVELPARGTGGQTEKLSANQMLACLPTQERAAVLLHYHFGMTHPEVADNMDIPLGTVKTLIRRGKDLMRRMHRGAPQ